MFAIKAEVSDAKARTFVFPEHNPMCGGRHVAPGDVIVVWNDGRAETELNFKFYRQATNKIVGLSDEAAAFLDGFF